MLPSRFANTLEELKTILTEIEKDTATVSILLLVADNNHPTADTINPILHAFKKKVIGGVFAEVIFQGQRKQEGMVIVPLDFDLNTDVIDLSLPDSDIMERLLATFPVSNTTKNHFFLFIDAFAEGKEKFMDCLYNCFGNAVTVLGAGAGSLSFKQIPCIISNAGLQQNVVVLGLASIAATIGVAHGWKPISKPLKITESDDTKLISLDWRPAFEVYKEIVEAHSDKEISEANFFEIAQSYPLGMVKLDAEHVVRDPYKVEGNTIFNLDRAEKGQYITVMNGNEASLIEAAKKARELIDEEFNAKEASKRAFFCIDCISRVLYMQDNFTKELAILKGDSTVNGALTLGEIANNGETFLEIYNKTVVLAKWEKTA